MVRNWGHPAYTKRVVVVREQPDDVVIVRKRAGKKLKRVYRVRPQVNYDYAYDYGTDNGYDRGNDRGYDRGYVEAPARERIVRYYSPASRAAVMQAEKRARKAARRAAEESSYGGSYVVDGGGYDAGAYDTGRYGQGYYRSCTCKTVKMRKGRRVVHRHAYSYGSEPEVRVYYGVPQMSGY